MFKNIGIVLKKNASLQELAVVQGLIEVLSKTASSIFAEEGTKLSLVIEKNYQEFQDQIDVYFATFAKSMASTGAFIAADSMIIDFLKYNMRSQVFAKSFQLQLVIGALKRLDMLRTRPEIRTKLWRNVKALQSGLKDQEFDLGTTQSCVTPVFLKGTVQEAMLMVKELREKYFIFCSFISVDE